MLDRDDLLRAYRKARFGLAQRRRFYRDIANAEAAGIPPIKAVGRLRDVSRPRRRLRWMVAILDDVLRKSRAGASFAGALQAWVPPAEAAMLSAGEDVGDIGQALRTLDGMLQGQQRIRTAMWKNLGPGVGMVFIVAGLSASITQMLGPQAKQMVPPEVMASLGTLSSYIALGDFFTGPAIFVAAGVIAAVTALVLSFGRWRPSPARRFLDSRLWWNPYALYARMQATYFMVTVSSQMQAGRTYRAAVESIQRFSTRWMRAYLAQMLGRLRTGMSEVQAMQVAMVPEDVSDQLAFYAALPDFSRVMSEVARDSMDILEARVQVVGTVMRLAGMIALAGFVLFTLLATYDMSDGMEKAMRAMSQH